MSETASDEIAKREAVASPQSAAASVLPRFMRDAIQWIAFSASVAFALIAAFPTVRAFITGDQWVIEAIRGHLLAAVGLPLMAVESYILVVTLEARFDKIEMEILGIAKFRGASGPIILWAFCLAVQAGLAKMLW